MNLLSRKEPRSEPPRNTPGENPAGRALDHPVLLATILFVTVAAVFLRSLAGKFIYFDEVWHVTQNPHVITGLTWSNFLWAFQSLEVANWYPLTWLSHMLDCQLYGLQPWGHHLTNVLLHAANTALVFLLLRKLTGATGRSFAVALLFGLHPLRVESVAWISERKDVLSLFFMLLAIWAYAGYAKMSKAQGPKSKVAYTVALLFFACGLMSKPTVVTLPCVLLLLDFWPLNRVSSFEFRVSSSTANQLETRNPKLGTLLLEKVPFLLLAALDSVLTSIAQKRAGMLNGYDTVTGHLTFIARLENALIAYCRYLGKLFWPVDLCTLYPHPGHWPIGLVILAGLLLLAVSLMAWLGRRRRPYLFVGWFWYVGTLVPMIGLVQAGPQSLADRYTYIPSLGLLLALVWSVSEWTIRWKPRIPWLAGATAAGAAACALATFQQIGYWRDGVTVWSRAIAVTQNNYIAHNNLATILSREGRMDEAIPEWEETIRLNSDFVEARHCLGDALAARDRLDDAIVQYVKALELQPDRAVVRNNLGNAYLSKKMWDDAIAQFEIILKADPNMAAAQANLGCALLQKNRLDEAILHLRRALELKPDIETAYNNLGYAWFKQGRFADANTAFRRAIALKPDFAEAHHNLSFSLIQAGRLDEAIAEFEEVVRLKPNDPQARKDLEIARAMKQPSPATPPATNRPSL